MCIRDRYDYEETIESLKRVFGIVGICPVVRVEDRGFEQLSKDVISYMPVSYTHLDVYKRQYR